MSDIFERLGKLFRSFLNAGENYSNHYSKYQDPYMQEAWDELEDFLNEDKKSEKKWQEFQNKTKSPKTQYEIEREKLRVEYNILKVPFTATFEEVKKSYKKLLQQYHPDRHAEDPEKYKRATEITSKINQAFQKIKEFENKFGN